MIKALIADDHPILRNGLKLFLTYSLDMHVAEAEDGQQVIEYISAHDVDILVLDLSMPGRTGLDILKQIKRLKPQLPVLILSAQPEEKYALRSMKAGAAGYLSKSAGTFELMGAIKKILAGGKYVSPSLAERLVEESTGEKEEIVSHDSLSDREFQILCQIASGKSVGEIAKELHLSVKTISTYRKRILEKMNLNSNSEIMQYALKHRLLETV